MKRTDMLNKMLACYIECKKMDYTDLQAMDRVLELMQELGMHAPSIHTKETVEALLKTGLTQKHVDSIMLGFNWEQE